MAFYRIKTFGRFARKHRIKDETLAAAANDVRLGRIDADLGGGLYKQRLARQGGGKSGGFRTLITSKCSEHLFFVYGFPKNAKANIDADELMALKAMAKYFGTLTNRDLRHAVANGELEEVPDGDEASQDA